ncbi:MAG: hypothetical protein Q9178_002073 [Gyalolechia marmorata]
MIWPRLMPECGGNHGTRQVTNQEAGDPSQWTRHSSAAAKGDMSILRTSMILYDEISADLYHDRDLHIRIHVSHNDLSLDVMGPPKEWILSVPWGRFRRIVFFIYVEEHYDYLRPVPDTDGTLRSSLHTHMKVIASKLEMAGSVRSRLDASPKFDLIFNIFVEAGRLDCLRMLLSDQLCGSIWSPFRSHPTVRSAIVRLPERDRVTKWVDQVAKQNPKDAAARKYEDLERRRFAGKNKVTVERGYHTMHRCPCVDRAFAAGMGV